MLLNTLSPNSDQHQISPCNINAYLTPEDMRIKDEITQGEFSCPHTFRIKVLGTRKENLFIDIRG